MLASFLFVLPVRTFSSQPSFIPTDGSLGDTADTQATSVSGVRSTGTDG